MLTVLAFAGAAAVLVWTVLASVTGSGGEKTLVRGAASAGTPAPTPSATPIPTPYPCENPDAGYALEAPASWEATDGSCTSFRVGDPVEGVTVRVVPEVGAFEGIRITGDLRTRQSGRIAGRDALRYLAEDTVPDEEVSADEGGESEVLVYGYILDRDGEGFLIALIAPASSGIEPGTRRVFDEAVAALNFA